MGYAERPAITPRQALRLAAPGTWAASLCPALFGVLYCWVRGASLGLLRALVLTAACVLLQSAVNTFNDYFDFASGTDSLSDHVEESDAVLVYGDFDPRQALWLAVAYLALGAAAGLLCCIGRGWTPILAGLAGGAAVLLYSAGPVPLSRLPIGELVSGFVMGGLIPLGVSGCADGPADFWILLWSLPLVLGISLIMMTNNGCDVEKDLRAGRHTLPSLLGRKQARLLYRCLTVLWLALLAVFPVLLLGLTGAASAVLLAVFGFGCFRDVLGFSLEPEMRIVQMKTIVRANLLGNGAYLCSLALALLGGRVHG